jgi:hypothetical protein
MEPESHRRRNLVVVAVVVVIAILLLGFFGVLPIFGNGTSTVVNGNIDVLLTACSAYPVVVGPGGPSTLQGSFEVLGGAPNQVQVLVMGAAAYGGFKSSCGVVAKGSAGFDYNSGQVNAATFSISLSGGATYYLVYNNPQLYNNVITTRVTLRPG